MTEQISSTRFMDTTLLAITLLGARHTRAPTTPKSRAAHQQSVAGETQSSRGAKIALQAHRRLKKTLASDNRTN